MDATVAIKMGTEDYQRLQTLLKYRAGKIDEEQFKAILVTMGYRPVPDLEKHIAEQSLYAIQ